VERNHGRCPHITTNHRALGREAHVWAFPTHSRSPPNYAEIEGVRMQYVEQGTGDAILFLH